MPSQTSSSYPQLIVASMPRTGTEFMKQALEMLYGNGARAYRMTKVLNRPKQIRITQSSILAAAYLRGETEVTNLLLNDEVSTDENGTSILDYLREFADYESCV